MKGVIIFIGIALAAIFGFGVLPGYISLIVFGGICLLVLYPANFIYVHVIKTWRVHHKVWKIIVNVLLLVLAVWAVVAIWIRNGLEFAVIAYLLAIVALEKAAL